MMSHGSGRKRLLLSLLVVLLVIAGGAAVLHFRAAHRPAAGDAAAGVALASTRQAAEGGKAGDDKDKDHKTPIPVSVAPIGVGSVSSYISATANLVPENEVQVLAEAEGQVVDLRVEEGDRVGRGHLLASLKKDDAEIAFRKAQLQASNAQMAFERAEKMLSDRLMSREDYDKVTLQNNVAQQELAEAKWMLDKTSIRAPFAGRVTRRDVKLGQHVRPGDVLFTVSDFDPLIARIYLPEKDVLGLKEGREVRIVLKADERTRFAGRIRQISPVVDTQTGTVKVTVEASSVPSEVRPGAFVTIDIVRQTRPRAVLLPREAVVRELTEAYVFVAKGEVAERRSVSLGLEENGRIEALSGVSPGERVIVAGQGGLKDGSPIKIIPAPEASDLGAPEGRPSRG
ncbi:MAG TPA: efflux RND transporter periplasmic adaptor subunit [Candidatus Polarisedimenticolia bacterium]|nr:efflux RND transporter periplasmic adaptor subunit [Candidatus Polarisedimenticolia bacterium]